MKTGVFSTSACAGVYYTVVQGEPEWWGGRSDSAQAVRVWSMGMRFFVQRFLGGGKPL